MSEGELLRVRRCCLGVRHRTALRLHPRGDACRGSRLLHSPHEADQAPWRDTPPRLGQAGPRVRELPSCVEVESLGWGSWGPGD